MTDETTKVTSIPRRLIEAQRHIKPVEKDKTNQYHRYAYASAETMMKEARRALNEAGLAVVRTGWTVQMGDPVMMTCTFAVVSEDGESVQNVMQWPVIPEKGRPHDKALAAALTASQSYFLRDLLQIPRVDESDEMDNRDDTDHVPEPVRDLGAESITAEQVASLMRGIGKSEVDVNNVCKVFGVGVLNDLTRRQLRQVIEYIQKNTAPEQGVTE